MNIKRRQYLQHVQVYLDQWQGSISWWSTCRSCCGECLSRQTVSSRSIPLSLRPLMCHHHSYRFRLVSISCDPSFVFSIDDHQMTVIEVEGTNVQPLVIDQLEIFVGACQCGSNLVIIPLINSKTGQRYSVVVRCSYSSMRTMMCLTSVLGHCEPANC